MVTRVAVQSRGPGSTHHNLPPGGQPRHMFVCGCNDVWNRQGALRVHYYTECPQLNKVIDVPTPTTATLMDIPTVKTGQQIDMNK